MSGQPSWSSSSSATPSDFELESKMPLVAVTSSNVPLPRLRNSQQVSPRYASGVQYDFCLPSRLQKTSCSARPLDVVADEQIEEAVAIEVEPQRRRAERRASAEAARAA